MNVETGSGFTLGRTLGSEDQLTEMLAWLISVAPEVGDKLIWLVIPGEDAKGLPTSGDVRV
jgi:hypothetical protein